MTKSLLDEIMTVSLRRGILYPSAEIYGGLAGFYDFGPIGTRIRKNLIDLWRARFVEGRDYVYEVSGNTILPSEVFKASGHLDHFTDPSCECSKGHITRIDQFIEDKLNIPAEGKTNAELAQIVREHKLKCPVCGDSLSEVKSFGLMFGTNVGGEHRQAFLRPETAQNIFLGFKRIHTTTRAKLPFGVAQIGRSYRNEISPRQSIVRVREFGQMEIEYFVHPGALNACPLFEKLAQIPLSLVTRKAQEKAIEESSTEYQSIQTTVQGAVEQGYVPNQWVGCILGDEVQFFHQLGIPPEAIRFRHMRKEETPHYSGGNFDLEVQFSFGWKEVIGNAYRRDHDLRSHMDGSQKDLSIDVEGEKVVPHVIEPSFGIDRIVYAVLEHTYRPKNDRRDWSWFELPPSLAPYKAVILPLLNRPELEELATRIFVESKEEGLAVLYDDRGRIGRRYARADEIGIPLAVTVDPESLEDDSATIRHRDTAEQTRHPVKEIPALLKG
ncbi:MAG: glycine--tRNA ligase [Candidatus Hermodarchaeota archaeon]|nr:glycine--tRNA ligase [Candidatus Hermodarchaeota archaeon]